MGLEQVQLFITRYVRDPAFRARYAVDAQRDLISRELGLNEEDVRYIRAIPVDDLDRTARGFRDDRLSKRQTEFQPWLNHLALYANVDEFLNQYDAAYPDGLETQPLEMDRFLSFGTQFILGNQLPEYLLELLRFCYHFCKIAVAPPDHPEGATDVDSEHDLKPYHRAKLRAPHLLLKFRFDVLQIANQEPNTSIAAQNPAPVSLFFQKDYERYKRTRIIYADQIPFLWQLIDEVPLVIDLLAPWSANEYPQLTGQLLWLHKQGFVHFINPLYMRG